MIGIVRRPYPGASDRRWSVVPRGPADVVIGARHGAAARRDGDGRLGAAAVVGARAGSATARGRARPASRTSTSSRSPTTWARCVRVGGLVEELAPDGFLLDDGTAIGRVALDRRSRRVPAARRAR